MYVMREGDLGCERVTRFWRGEDFEFLFVTFILERRLHNIFPFFFFFFSFPPYFFDFVIFVIFRILVRPLLFLAGTIYGLAASTYARRC